jgi:hypothetical protein
VFPRMRDLRGEAYPAEPSLAFPAAVAESEDHEGIPGSDTKVSQPAAGREGCEADHRGTESRAWRLGNPLRTGKAGWEFKRPDTFVRKRLRRWQLWGVHNRPPSVRHSPVNSFTEWACTD